MVKCNIKLQWESRIYTLECLKDLQGKASKNVEQQVGSFYASVKSNFFGKLAFSATVEHLNILWSINYTPPYLTNWNSCICASIDVFKDVHSIICNNQNQTQLKVGIKSRNVTCNIFIIWNTLQNENEWNTVVHKNLNESHFWIKEARHR